MIVIHNVSWKQVVAAVLFWHNSHFYGNNDSFSLIDDSGLWEVWLFTENSTIIFLFFNEVEIILTGLLYILFQNINFIKMNLIFALSPEII